jgi:hypothetical protein
MSLSHIAATTFTYHWRRLRWGQMSSIRCCVFLLISLLSKRGFTFLHRPKLDSRFSFARLDSRAASQNTSSVPPANGYIASSIRTDLNNAGSASVLFDQNAPSFGTSVNAGRSNYRNSGSELPLTVSSSIGSHSYRENRPSNEKSDRDRDRATGSSLRGNKDKPIGNGNGPYRGRGSSRSTSSGGGPDVIFSSGFDSNRVSQRGKETSYSSDNSNSNSRDSRDSNSNQRAFSKPWKSRRPFDPTSRGIESTQDYPISSYRTIVYDHLATSSLEGIEALPHIKFSKGRTYLSRWWLAAKKWNLLGAELKEIDAAFQSKDDNNDISLKGSSSANSWNDISNRRIEDETGRISTVLSQILKSRSDGTLQAETLFDKERAGRNVSVSEGVKDDVMLRYEAMTKASLGGADIAAQESELDYDRKPLLDDPLQIHLSPEPIMTALGDWDESIEGQQVDMGIGFGEDEALDKSWDVGTDASHRSSNSNNNDIINSSKQKVKDSPDSWTSNKDDDDGAQSSSSAFEGQWSADSPRASSESDLSTPIDALYSLCDKHKARVICIGDVHGCVEELKDLLREVNYRPGDLVLLLGDLVAKG